MEWNQRYAVGEYVYGTEPNGFLAEHAKELTGPVLSLAEGEGRNAVFLASLGLKVHGVDGSEVGLAKARALARSRGLEIQTEVADLALFVPDEARKNRSRVPESRASALARVGTRSPRRQIPHRSGVSRAIHWQKTSLGQPMELKWNFDQRETGWGHLRTLTNHADR